MTVNPGFESNELNMVESVYLPDESMKESKGRPAGGIQAVYDATDNFMSKHRKFVKFVLLTLLNLAVLIYFVFATMYWKRYNNDFYDWCHGYGLLIILLTLVYGGILYRVVSKRFLGKLLDKCIQPCSDAAKSVQKAKYGFIVKAAIYICAFVVIIVFLIIDTAESRERLMSGIGVITLISFGWIFSKYPGHINWRPVLCGLLMQFVFGFLTIRWPVGRAILKCVAGKVETFLNFAKSGAIFTFGDQLVNDGIFAFSALPVIFYFSFFIQIFYYLGVMQWLIFNLGRLLQGLLSTSICESVTCAGNIFLGMSESPLVIKPYLNKMTTSELHTVMCSGFATVSGTVLAAYIKFGANPAHLITATLMAAPAALCFSKLFYPETEKITVTAEHVKLVKSEDTSLIDAASKGAVAAIPLILGIIANIVAFVSFIALINSLLSWIGLLVGYEALSFELILSKVFMPLSWIMGVPWEKCEDVGTLIGLKTVVNEFVAYQKLGEFKKQNRISGRTEAIATFAICGFANPGSVGIMLSMLIELAPDKKENVSSAVVRAFIAGNAVCFLTASFVGLLMPNDYITENSTMILNTTAS
ncbi:uncharacterized protein LOC108622254 isoform X1 [Ceratina calcarata]|uniref:Uncharacterized protein LOC108622254 isoform X1 n=1 Tax=Ceratina calcarata TaxID=156304 RepID=A0AAJ7W8R3_9HYME|nr:uncharacterized protein LOC108622254 isoform X1 [Ceratina calcarata]XP_026667156.1 uncharacterized protein LOC108622254 isoform X2 [Ceratina calcarata]XP_026667157.1 uncharacterized protein LOC108622254 isoform X1 [Ceratina calcarata]XP_026667158.1 uncharacterized protein LOC108622254 isoform X1 [Ceratina calcarata]